MTAPLLYIWNGESMTPLPRFAKEADRRFVIGENYALDEIEERSSPSHNHQFASLKEAWLQLPESIAPLYPSPEHLRKRALIEAGFFNEQIVDAGSHAAALRVAAAFRSREEFSVVSVSGSAVVIRSAKSQKRRLMEKDEFQRSKEAVLEIAWGLVGMKPGDAERHVEAA
jgi:hypothetical protein